MAAETTTDAPASDYVWARFLSRKWSAFLLIAVALTVGRAFGWLDNQQWLGGLLYDLTVYSGANVLHRAADGLTFSIGRRE